jgi:hypothetical protein
MKDNAAHASDWMATLSWNIFMQDIMTGMTSTTG